jgi:hypothetical protein
MATAAWYWLSSVKVLTRNSAASDVPALLERRPKTPHPAPSWEKLAQTTAKRPSGVHGNGAPDLAVRGGRVDLELGGERSAGGAETTGEHAGARAVMRADPGDDEATGGVHGDVGSSLRAGHVLVDPELVTEWDRLRCDRERTEAKGERVWTDTAWHWRFLLPIWISASGATEGGSRGRCWRPRRPGAAAVSRPDLRLIYA